MATDGAPGVFTISLDFELHWGVWDSRSLEAYRPNLLGAREAIPRLLELFARYGVHATWATVGYLFCRDAAELRATAPQLRPSYTRAELSTYPGLATVGADETADPVHYGASLVEQIRACPGQEVGSHTFCHYYCLEPGQTAAEFAADLAAANAAAERLGVDLRSLVFPRNQIHPAYLPLCREAGLTSYRSQLDHWLYRPRSQGDESRGRRALRLLDAYLPLSGPNAVPHREAAGEGLVALPASRFLRPYSRRLRRLEPLRLRRIAGGMNTAARRGLVYHLWWHPHNFGVNLEQNLAFLTQVLERYRALQEQHGMVSLNMGELAAEALR